MTNLGTRSYTDTQSAARTILVTGASGFLGPYVVQALLDEGWRVRLALRRPIDITDNLEYVIVGQINGSTFWDDALSGVDGVVHLATQAHRTTQEQQRYKKLYVETNVDGTLQLAKAAADIGVKDFLFMSSIAVHTGIAEGAPIAEDAPLSPITIYGQTKVAAEQGLLAIGQASDMAVTIVRPPLIYGRPPKANFSILVRAVSAGIPLPFASISNRRAFIAAENVASFIVHRLRSENMGTKTFIVADAEHLSTPNFIRSIARALGTPPRLFATSPAILSGCFGIMGRDDLRSSLLASLEVDTSKAYQTGWRPAVTLEEGLRRALASFRN